MKIKITLRILFVLSEKPQIKQLNLLKGEAPFISMSTQPQDGDVLKAKFKVCSSAFILDFMEVRTEFVIKIELIVKLCLHIRKLDFRN